MKSTIEWKFWGESDPLFGVSSVAGRSKRGANPWTEEDFYARSESEWQSFRKRWESYGLNPDTCVEIGCGVGRMTSCLQKTFRSIHACDVAEGMVAYARKHCDSRIVQFHVTDGQSLPLESDSVTAAFSTIVFQHFHSPEDSLSYFRELHRVFVPGGTFMLNVPLYNFPNGPAAATLLPASYWIVRQLSNARAASKRTILLLGSKMAKTPFAKRIVAYFGGYMHSTRYPFPWLYRSLLEIGFRDVEVWTAYIPSEERCQDFVFGRKPETAKRV